MDTLNNEEQGFGKPVTHHRQGQKRKRAAVRVFPSNVVGQRITNAMTGSQYDYKVGSNEELRLFRVITSQPFHKHVNLVGDEVVDADGYQVNKLFYDTPEQYEKHKRTTLSDEVKKQWYDDHPQHARPADNEDDDVNEIIGSY